MQREEKEDERTQRILQQCFEVLLKNQKSVWMWCNIKVVFGLHFAHKWLQSLGRIFGVNVP
jgi:hypothetical protein